MSPTAARPRFTKAQRRELLESVFAMLGLIRAEHPAWCSDPANLTTLARRSGVELEIERLDGEGFAIELGSLPDAELVALEDAVLAYAGPYGPRRKSTFRACIRAAHAFIVRP